MFKWLRLPVLLAIAALVGLTGFRASTEMQDQRDAAPGQNAEDQLRPERMKLMPPEQIVSLISPKKGSTVLDFGAGYGMFTFTFARAVGAKGKVFATDTDPRAVTFLKEKALKEGLKNVVPVRVQPNGLDSFYAGKVYDTVMVADVLPLIESPEELFGQLRPMLRKNSGRLWVVDLRLDPDFTVLEFDNFASLGAVLSRQDEESPLVRRLSPPVRQAMASPPAPGSDASMIALLTADLNAMLDDPKIWPEIQAQKISLGSRESKLRQHLSRELTRAGIFAAGAVAKDSPHRGTLRMLNRLVIQDLLGSNHWEKAFSLDNLYWEQWEPLLARLSAGQDYPAIFRKAGYQEVREHKGLPYHLVWEFKRSN
jgi:SAM-dependent methyltransferase